MAPGEEIMAVSVGDGPGSMLSTPEVFLISERFYARAVSGGER